MQGFEINNIFDSFPELKKHYKGIFAVDTIPNQLKFRHFCICNTDKSSGIGIHWFCFLRNSNNTVECFDSLGVTEEKKDILRNICKFKGVSEIEFNETQFQANDSDSCGFFTIYFILERMHNLDLTFETLLEEIFVGDNYEINETKVKNFMSKLLTN